MSRLIWHRVITKLIALFHANFSLKTGSSEIDATRTGAWRTAALTVADDDLHASQLASLSSQGTRSDSASVPTLPDPGRAETQALPKPNQ